MDPPMTGHAVQYERLWLEEVALEKERANILQSSSEDNDEQQQCQLENYQFRSMIHRASLEGMLISAQCAATKVTSHNNPKSSSSLPASAAALNKNNYERGLENEDSVNALLALRDIRMRELEEANNKLPFANIGGSSSARCWKQNYPLGADSSSSSSSVKQEAATANSFFDAFPECKRSLNTADESDENDDDDNDEIVQQQQSKSKRKGKGASPIVVSSPSPDRPPNNDNEDDEVQLITTTTKNQQQQQKQQIHTQNNHNTNVTSSITSNNQHHQANKSRGGYQQHQHVQSQGQHQNRVNNNNSNLPTLPQHNNNVNYHNPYQNHQNHHHHQSAPAKFDYNDTSGGYDEQQQQHQQSNSNPFRTAKELGANFDPKRRQQQQQEQQHRGGGGGGRRDNRNNNWDDYENDNNTSNNLYSGGNRLAGGGGGGRSGSGPQQMVRAAIRGPNMSAGLKRKFQPPLKREGSNSGPAQSNSGRNQTSSSNNSRNNSSSNNNNNNNSNPNSSNGNEEEELPEELRGLDKELIEKINNEIVDNGQKVTFDDIAGLENAKNTVNELVIYPMKRPDLFTGLRACPKGLLLFGPPGTGKTLIGKAISHESGATFFSISSSSLTSKWIGEGEKLVKTLFAVASYRSPSVVFIDEVDSMLTQRKSDENEASRRIKTEFLVQLDGAGNDRKGHVLVIGATNLPQELDDAARRRFVKRLYIPLPDQPGRETLLRTLLAKNRHSLTDKEIIKLSRDTDGYSGADLKNLCTDAAMGPMRTMTAEQMMRIDANDVPPIAYKHFRQSLRGSSPSVAQADLQVYIDWNNTYGSKVSNESDDDDDDDEEEEEEED